MYFATVALWSKGRKLLSFFFITTYNNMSACHTILTKSVLAGKIKQVQLSSNAITHITCY